MGVIVITGGSRGIGASTAEHVAQRGMGVILTYNTNPQDAAMVVDRIEQAGGKAVALKLDVSDVATFEAFGESVRLTLLKTWGATTLSGLVNNAGYGLFNPWQPLAKRSSMAFSTCISKALFPHSDPAAAVGARRQYRQRHQRHYPRIHRWRRPYAAFKGGLEVLTRYMAKEFGERRIRANAVSPGAIRTELGGGLNDEFEAMLAAQTALGRVGEPSDVARVIAMLLSEEGAWINAQTLEVSGGYNI
ncbi:SDR family oxidoreductase [Pseudomonas sp. NA13]